MGPLEGRSFCSEVPLCFFLKVLGVGKTNPLLYLGEAQVRWT